MQVVILAGGLGLRLRPITDKIPKVMLNINGKPFLYYVLELLKSKSFKKVLILIGYLGEQIKDYFGDGKKFGLSLSYSFEESLLGTGGAIKKAASMIDSNFLLIYGDTYLEFDYHDFIKTYYKLDKTGFMCVYTNKQKDFKDNVLMNSNNRIIKYDKNNLVGLSGVDAGIFVFKKKVLDLIPSGRNVSFEECVYQKLISRKEFFAYPTDKKFLDIGNFEMLKRAKKVLL